MYSTFITNKKKLDERKGKEHANSAKAQSKCRSHFGKHSKTRRTRPSSAILRPDFRPEMQQYRQCWRFKLAVYFSCGVTGIGADIIELGVPFSDPIADGPTIQKSSFVALQNGITIKDCLSFVKTARASGLTVPVVLMGYANPFLSYGEVDLISQCQEVGICGFIIVDLPPDEAVSFRSTCAKKGLSYIPLIAPSTSEERIQNLVAVADSFIYVVSAMGVTGARSSGISIRLILLSKYRSA